jgi:hypothetical protein
MLILCLDRDPIRRLPDRMLELGEVFAGGAGPIRTHIVKRRTCLSRLCRLQVNRTPTRTARCQPRSEFCQAQMSKRKRLCLCERIRRVRAPSNQLSKCTNEKVSLFDSGSLRAACFVSYEFEGSRLQLQRGCGTGILRARLLPWRLLRSRVWVLLLPTRLLPPRQLSRLLLWQRLPPASSSSPPLARR